MKKLHFHRKHHPRSSPLSPVYPPNPILPPLPVSSQQATITNLRELIAGRFQSATDKKGTGGTLISISNLIIEHTRHEADGDTHLSVKDESGQGLICEITPQHPLPIPTLGQMFTIIGIAFCDAAHETEVWHFNTCWEIHPVIELKQQ
jgi:hypothetical protein